MTEINNITYIIMSTTIKYTLVMLELSTLTVFDFSFHVQRYIIII